MRRCLDDLGLSEDRIIKTAKESRSDQPNPPDGPTALDRFMERAAQRDAQKAASAAVAGKAKRRRKSEIKPPPSDDEVANFYAAKVN